MEHDRLEGSVMPFSRRWHVIQGIDLVRLIGAHHRRAALCDRLEAVADALPTLPTPEKTAALCEELVDTVMRDECDELPYLEKMLLRGPDALADALLDHLRLRQSSDAAMAQELIAALRPEAEEHRPAADALAYLLRCLFSGCRRAIDYEQLAIMALAGDRLTASARMLLVKAIASRAVA